MDSDLQKLENLLEGVLRSAISCLGEKYLRLWSTYLYRQWPHKRIAAWDALLKARAIENMAYCLGVNRIGTDGSDLSYPGHTTVFDYMGEVVGKTQENKAGNFTLTLDKEAMHLARKKLNFLNDRDRFTLH